MNIKKNIKMVVIFLARPGAGKGTQAEIVAKKFGLTHLETSKIIEEKLKNAPSDNKELQKEKERWVSGKLNSPEKVAVWTKEKIRRLAKQGHGLVMSGSPRTLFEAKRVMPLLEDLYGKNNMQVVNIRLSIAESIKRNSHRRICKKSRHPIPNLPKYRHLTTCPDDGSELITRALDNPETIRIRNKEYENRTKPILRYLKEREYKIHTIDGEQSIEAVSRDILKELSAQEL